eukprot:155639_1
MDEIDYVALVVTIFNIFIYCPILIYYAYRYRYYEKKEMRNNARNVIHQRDSCLVYTINILAIFTNCTERIFMVSSEVWRVIDVPFWSVCFFQAVTWWALMDLFAIKIHLLYYRQQLNQSIADQVWKKHINPGIDDWYILNKHKYGNALYLIKIAFIPYLISVLMDTCLFAVLLGGGLLQHVSHLILASIPISIALFVFKKVRKLNDRYKIRNEIWYQFVMLLSTLCVWMVIFLVCHVICEDFLDLYNHQYIHRIEYMLYLFITEAVTFALALFSTAYPLYVYMHHKELRAREPRYKLCRSTSSGFTATESPYQSTQQLVEMISDYKWFKLFIHHLVLEFCTENLLFVVELYQIKLAFQIKEEGVIHVPETDIFDIHRDDFDGHTVSVNDSAIPYIMLCCHSDHTLTDYAIQLRLPREVPQSIIQEKCDTLSDQMKDLYQKYIKEGSDFELNISHESRIKLRDFIECIDDITEERQSYLYCLFDECCIEILFLLDGPFHRFVDANQSMKSTSGSFSSALIPGL